MSGDIVNIGEHEDLVGRRVESLRAFSGVPQGTQGVIDEVYGLGYHWGFMVAWDLPAHPLPAGYRRYDNVPAVRSGILRDGFSADEARFLKLV